jgi:sugar phosphate isomerase/epimerase
MQGRLLPKFNGRYQAHPVGYWEGEFALAAHFSLKSIEFILDKNDLEKNPLMNDDGVQKILLTTKETGVQVNSICADYFMQDPISMASMQNIENIISIFKRLMSAATILGVKNIVIPCVDESSINDDESMSKFLEIFPEIISDIEIPVGLNLALETDLSPKDFSRFLERLDRQYVSVNYDIGNSAALGFNFHDELSAYGSKITDIHIKDRLLGGMSVVLGSGDADIPGFIKALEKYHYSGPFVMQAYRDDQGIDVFEEQLNWVSAYLK